MRAALLTVLVVSAFLLSCTQTATGTVTEATAVEKTADGPAAVTDQASQNPLAYTCSKGMTNDPAPGSCNSYVDSNGDGWCDRGQSENF